MFAGNVGRSMYLIQLVAQYSQEKQAISQNISLLTSAATKVAQGMNNPFEINGPQEQQAFARVQQIATMLGKLELRSSLIDKLSAAADAEKQGVEKAITKDAESFNLFK